MPDANGRFRGIFIKDLPWRRPVNQHGQAARFAYNPEAVLAFLAFLDGDDPTYAIPRMGWDDNIHGRTVRRWRKAKGITKTGLNTVLSCYPGVGSDEYVKWAEANGYAPVLRNR